MSIPRSESKLKALTYTLIITVVTLCVSVHTTSYLFDVISGDTYFSIMLVSVIAPLIVAPPAAYVLSVYALRLIDMQEELVELAVRDTLTGLLNRRAFTNIVETERLRMRRSGAKASILLIDVDHFKAVNTQLGHPGGDEALRQLSDLMLANFRPGTDHVARWGGEEFIVSLAETSLAGAAAAANRLRKRVETKQIHFEGQSIRLTVSIGIAELSVAEEFERVVERADKCLLKAKTTGRNKIIVAGPSAVASVA